MPDLPTHVLQLPDWKSELSESVTSIDELLKLVCLERRELNASVQAAEDFPTPPVPASEMQAKLDAYTAARLATVLAETQFREQHAIKDEALDDLIDSTKADLKYAEFAVRDRPEKLKQLGWAPRRRGSALEGPGEVRNMAIAGEGDTWVVLRWKPPVEGDKATFYRIQRKVEDSPWEDFETSTHTEQLMSNQPRGVELDFRVFAVNKAGEGTPSATVTVVL